MKMTGVLVVCLLDCGPYCSNFKNITKYVVLFKIFVKKYI